MRLVANEVCLGFWLTSRMVPMLDMLESMLMFAESSCRSTCDKPRGWRWAIVFAPVRMPTRLCVQLERPLNKKKPCGQAWAGILASPQQAQRWPPRILQARLSAGVAISVFLFLYVLRLAVASHPPAA